MSHMDATTLQRFQAFLDGWTESPAENKKAFLRLKERLAGYPGVTLDFVAREGVTYSLRAVHEKQKAKPLFVMVDVIEDDPRWLSICFYGEMITDPEEHGDFVPEGLLGEDAHCFDLESWDESQVAYIEARLDEARESAAKG